VRTAARPDSRPWVAQTRDGRQGGHGGRCTVRRGGTAGAARPALGARRVLLSPAVGRGGCCSVLPWATPGAAQSDVVSRQVLHSLPWVWDKRGSGAVFVTSELLSCVVGGAVGARCAAGAGATEGRLAFGDRCCGDVTRVVGLTRDGQAVTGR
jgi:hypothetical protein